MSKTIPAKELQPGDRSGRDTVERVRVDEPTEGIVTITWVDRLNVSVWKADTPVNVETERDWFSEWQAAVANRDTTLGYIDWARNQT